MRLFLGIFPPKAVRHRLAAVELPPPLQQGFRAVPPQNLHLTTLFLGSVADERVAALRRKVAAALAPAAPMAVRLSGRGVFPKPARARVAWLGAEPGEELAALHYTARHALANELKLDDRPYHAHLTLGRWRRPPPLGHLYNWLEHDGPEPLAWTCDAVSLVRSRTNRHGAIYELVEELPLRG